MFISPLIVEELHTKDLVNISYRERGSRTWRATIRSLRETNKLPLKLVE